MYKGEGKDLKNQLEDNRTENKRRTLAIESQKRRM